MTMTQLCERCAGTGDLTMERDASGKKTGKYIPGTDENYVKHCIRRGDLAQCNACQGTGKVIKDIPRASMEPFMRCMGEMIVLCKDMSGCSPPEYTERSPEFRNRAIQLRDQYQLAQEEVGK